MAEDLDTGSLTGPILDLVSRVEKLLHRQASHPHQRMLVALAGVPGSGKSTVSHALLQELTGSGTHDVAVVPMVSLDLRGISKCSSLDQLRRMASTIPKRLFQRSTTL